MTDKEKLEMSETIVFMTELYYKIFASFYGKCGNIDQAYRLTRDMHEAMFNQNKKDSLSIFWNK